MQWLPLSRHTAQTSLGTTRFFLSIHLPHLSCIIPCSYWALTWVAVLPTCMTSYEISVRQTRDLPVSWYIPHIQLPSDSISRWTPLPSAISFPLPGGFGICTRWKRAPLGALAKPRLQVDSLGMLYNLHSRHNAPKKSLIAEGVTS